ncbi:ribonuclease E inhibitor RraB [Amycolatopsis samaneae]|uniref:Ribonuclease E inhibitor RraB n=1 Tax=Amycolatopsis samaneae TaxID=664691 RepID=A0ABW5GNW0_9PSEU
MSFLKQLRDLLKKRESPALTPDTPGLKIVVEAFDPAEADSSVLARSPGWVPDAPAVLRHHLTLPRERVAEAAAILAQDGWDLREPAETEDSADALARVEAQRVQVLDALHCAQERSRMAGLAQRLGGDSLGWDARQPGESPTAPA